MAHWDTLSVDEIHVLQTIFWSAGVSRYALSHRLGHSKSKTNSLVASLIIAFSGNLLPLSLYPDWAQTLLFLQPFASFLDIPFRIYFGGLTGIGAAAGLAVQSFWIVVAVLIGRAWMNRVMAKLQMQGG